MTFWNRLCRRLKFWDRDKAPTGFKFVLNQPRPNLWQQMESMNWQQWQSCACYLYRVGPRIHPGHATGSPAYLHKFIRPFNPEEVERMFGAGSYRAVLCKNKMPGDPPGPSLQQLSDEYFSIGVFEKP